jgi:hypothetical protein
MKVSTYQGIVGAVSDLKGALFQGRTKPYRVRTKVWKHMLINEKDTIVIKGKVRRLIGKNIGAGVYEVWLKEIQ